jgi:hypothetical protein
MMQNISAWSVASGCELVASQSFDRHMEVIRGRQAKIVHWLRF